MKLIGFGLLLLLLSCGQDNAKEKELALKEKEIELRERELRIKQNESSPKGFSCESFVGSWSSSMGKIEITKEGEMYLIKLKGYSHSGTEASPCNNGQLKSEGMDLTYVENEDAFYWDSHKWTRTSNSE